MFLSRLAVRRPVLMTMFIGFFVVFGLVAGPRMPVELLPRIEIPYLLVSIVYPGAGPEDIEASALVPLEDALGLVNNVASMRSSAVPDAGFVVLEFEMGTELDRALREVRSQLESVDRELPPAAWRPTVEAIDMNAAPVIQLAVTGDRPLPELTEWVVTHLQEPLSRIEGVAVVELVGDRQREVQVEVDQGLLLGHHLTLGHVVEAVRAGGAEIPSGTVADGQRATTVRLTGAYDDVAEIRQVALQAPLGEVLPLSAVARVQDGVAPEINRARVHGRPAIGVAIYKRAEGNTVALGRVLQQRIDQIRAEADEDIGIHLVHDASVSIRVSVQNLVATIGLCIALASALLWFFLHDWRGTAIVAVSIPCSMIGSLAPIYLSGFTINYMTLMGLAITVGTLVDASIVVLESIARQAREQPDSKIAADLGTGRAFLGVVGSTVTNIVVFTPIAFMQGIAGQFFKQFALTVSYSMVLSLLMSLTLTPMLAAWLYRNTAGKPVEVKRSQLLIRAWNAGYRRVQAWFRRAIRWSLGHRLLTLAGLALVIVVGVGTLAPVVPLGWFTNPDQGFFIARITLPRDADLEQTARAVERFEAAAYANPAVRTVFSQVGRYHTLFGEIDARNRAEFHVVVDNEAQHTAEVIDQLRPALSRAIPGAELLLKELGGGESAIRDDFMVDIYGPDPVVLAGLAEQVIEAFEAQPNISDVSATGDEFSTEIQVFPDRARVARAGLDPAQLGLLLRVAIEGDVEARLREGDDEYAIRVRLREQERLDAAGVAATTIQTASGAQIPLRELARVEEVLTPSLISRQERVRRATVTANLAWGASADTTEAVRALLDDPPEGYTIRIGGEEEQRTEAVGEISAALLLAIVLTTMLLAGLLESFSHPFAILSTLPLALVGVLVALAATGVPLDIFGLMALVMLVGIVVNNAILMLEETGHQRREGVPIHEALERGALLRLRPILMTSLSTVAGMVPLALALGPGAELRQAMALVSIGGVAVSSVLILIACPVIYSLIESAKRGLRLG